MIVIPVSQFLLGKYRKKVERAFQSDDWAAVLQYEPLMMRAVDVACKDPDRYMPSLLREVSVTLHLYQKLVDTCQNEVNLTALEIE
jgi:hypothetical protein